MVKNPFEYPLFFLLFILIPFIIIFFIFDILQFKSRAKKISGKNTKLIIPYYTEGQKWIRLVFYTLGFCLLIFALARPRWGIETIETDVKGRDILFVLDVSNSMDTRDVIPSRFHLAKRNISELLKTETGDRIGLLVFSEESELVSPVTFDYAALQFFLDSTYPGMLGKGGTNIGSALLNATESFDDIGISHKMIILMTDGENIQGDLKKVIKKVKESEIRIYTVGIGTSNGKQIPIYDKSGELNGWIKDSNNNIVVSKLDEKNLKYIANETGGKFLGKIDNYYANNLNYYLKKIQNVEKKSQESLKYEQKKERYDIFLVPALILLCMGFILDQGKIIKPGVGKIMLFLKNNKSSINNKNIIIICCIILLSFFPFKLHSNESEKSKIEKIKNRTTLKKTNGGYWGNCSFEKEKYKKALQEYFSAINSYKENELAKLFYNIGNTYYKLNNIKKANNFYNDALNLANNDELKSKIFYNQGLCEFKNHNYSSASELFKESLKFNSNDDDARYNYTVSSLLKNEGEKDYKQQNDENNQNKNDEEKNKEDKFSDEKVELSKEDIEKILKILNEKEKKENIKKTEDEKEKSDKRTIYW